MRCNNCGAEVADGIMFCGGCGIPIQRGEVASNENQALPEEATKKFCTNCGAPLSNGQAFCNACGNPVPNAEEVVLVEDSNKKSKTALLRGTIIGLVLSFIIIPGYLLYDFRIVIGGGVGLIIFLVSLFQNIFVKAQSIVVTNTRVSKICKDGKRIDIPMDTITLTKATAHFNGMFVYGRQRCKFQRLTNRDHVYSVINKRLRELYEEMAKAQAEEARRQAEAQAEENKRREEQARVDAQYRDNVLNGLNAIQNASGADEIRKYKELFDQGIISEEEFNAKKKQLLGI